MKNLVDLGTKERRMTVKNMYLKVVLSHTHTHPPLHIHCTETVGRYNSMKTSNMEYLVTFVKYCRGIYNQVCNFNEE